MSDTEDSNEENKNKGGRPKGSKNKKPLTRLEYEEQIKTHSAEAIVKLAGHMGAEDENLSYRACIKFVEAAAKLFEDDKKTEVEQLRNELARLQKVQAEKDKELEEAKRASGSNVRKLTVNQTT